MKLTAISVLMLLMFSGSASAQSTTRRPPNPTPAVSPAVTPSPTPTPPAEQKKAEVEPPKEIARDPSEWTEDERQLKTEFERFQANAGLCAYINFASEDCKRYTQEYLTYLVGKISRSKNLMDWIGSKAVFSFLKAGQGGMARLSAMQVSQLADEQSIILSQIMIAQNRRIIELLEQLVQKP